MPLNSQRTGWRRSAWTDIALFGCGQSFPLQRCDTWLDVCLSRTIRCSAIDTLSERPSNSGSAAIRPRRNGALQGVAFPKSDPSRRPWRLHQNVPLWIGISFPETKRNHFSGMPWRRECNAFSNTETFWRRRHRGRVRLLHRKPPDQYDRLRP